MTEQEKIELLSEGHMSIQEAADFLGICRDSVVEMLNDRRLPFLQFKVSTDPKKQTKVQRRIPKKAVRDFALKHLQEAIDVSK